MDKVDSRRERKKQETRQHLLVAAWQLFNEQGYDQTTVADITETVDVAKGTFFNYFATKEAIVDQIVLWRIDLLGSRVLGSGDVPERAVDRIKLLMTAMADEFSLGRELTRHLFKAHIGAPIHRESAHRIGSLIQKLVIQGQASGEIRDDVEPGFVARLLMTCWFYFTRHWHTDDHASKEANLTQAVDVLMNGLHAQKGGQGEALIPGG